MNVQEVQARMEAQLTGLEEQESRLQEWLECLRRLEGIAAEWSSEPMEKVFAETQQLVEEPVKMLQEEARSKTAEDPFDQLRRRLNGKPGSKSTPVFSSGILFRARA
jgi:DNA repair ATPase RecN